MVEKMNIKLKPIVREDVETVWKMQVEAFSELLNKYQDYDMRFQDIRKGAGNQYEALMIGPKDSKMSVTPSLNLTNAFKEYENGMPFNEILDKLADIRMHAALPNFNKEDNFVPVNEGAQ